MKNITGVKEQLKKLAFFLETLLRIPEIKRKAM